VPNTQSKDVNLTKRVQTSKGLRYCPVALSANGRVKPDLVIVNGQQERHPEGAYYLEWRENGRRVRLSVGKDPADASARRQRKEAELNALNNGVTVVPANGGDDGHKSVEAAVVNFLDETELTKKPKTLAAYTTALPIFGNRVPGSFLRRSSAKTCSSFVRSCVMRRSKHRAASTTSSRS
jgi:hypothetical protein